ncbi:MAG: VWA domain-containing protein [Pseudomonadales bacterium]|nr:VWA domain-containing protein [Pseudomonadales bacterium]
MLIDFFLTLKRAKVPVSLRELLDLIVAMKKGLVFADVDQFYFLSRAIMVKDESHYDKFDIAFGVFFRGLDSLEGIMEALIPDDWIRKAFSESLSEEEKAAIESMGGLEKLIEEFKKRLEEQDERHEGGNKWIGTGGTSPFGNGGFNPEGVRVGGDGNENFRAVKVWEQRDFKDLDDNVEIGTREIKMALRKLRKFARTGAEEELDIDDTIRSTARNAGMLDIKMVAERHNSIKVLIFFDVGGSMDPHVKVCEELFSATRSQFKHLKYFYFHNFIYESVWSDNSRRNDERTPTWDILHKYSSDYKIIFVGDASMAPYEVANVGGSIEHDNEEAGATWMERFTEVYDKIIWLNPQTQDTWEYSSSISMVQHLLEDKMFPLTLRGLDEGITYLNRS